MDEPVLAEVVRSGLVESRHAGSLVALGADGMPVLTAGRVDRPVYGRSANKPLQATAMVRAGLVLAPPLLAVACASHDGGPDHVAAVRTLLRGAGLGPDDLGNTPSLPLAERWAHDVVRAGGHPSALLHNCSGKHAAMLATCVRRGWPVETYLDPGHPLQQLITDAVAELAGEPVAHVGVDGCGAPVQALSLTGLARAFGRIAASPAGTPEGDVAAAMRSHPELVGGEGRDVTVLMRAVAGLVVKDGAEAVMAAGLADGRAVALKIADGAWRARPPVLIAALAALGVDLSGLPEALTHPPVLGGGRRVGEVRALSMA